LQIEGDAPSAKAVRIFAGVACVASPGRKSPASMGYNAALHSGDRDAFAAYRRGAGQRPGKLPDFR